ncbi:NUDIX domain-containing protein [Streptomyces coelicoflavus]|uniref:NUDIX domain-containing protein n=1 Tax=Streptomyces coelicoflavus TaxID=285562 RepID=UPI00368A7684
MRTVPNGGHLEPSDETLLQAAGRELTEETGIPPHVVTPHVETPLHIDIHPIDDCERVRELKELSG